MEETLHFDEIATEYDDSLPPHVIEHYLDKRVKFITDLSPARSILDVGCGTGVLASRLADQGFDLTGIDPSSGMLEVLQERDQRISVTQGSATSLPFSDEEFDLTYCVAVMHHIAQPEDVSQSIAEMVRVTKPSGLILIWDHNPRNPYWKYLMAKVPQDDGSERLVPEAELLSNLTLNHAALVRTDRLGFVPDFIPPRLLGMATRVENYAERVPGLRSFAAHNVVVARKN